MTDIDNISRALVIVIQYLGSERNDEEYTEDDDLKIVEEAASILVNATSEEKAALIKVAKELGLNEWAAKLVLSKSHNTALHPTKNRFAVFVG